ncbi:hypothetical protein CYMTET_51574, partial [Cymbomonas tetramitiformis]
VHGWALQSGIDIYTTFVQTYKRNYIDLNRTYGLGEQSAIMDVLKRSADFSQQSLFQNNKKWWQVPMKDVDGHIAAPPGNNTDYIRCHKNKIKAATPLEREECNRMQVEYAKIQMLNCKEWNCLRPFSLNACSDSRVIHFKGDMKRKMIEWLEENGPNGPVVKESNAAKDDVSSRKKVDASQTTKRREG